MVSEFTDGLENFYKGFAIFGRMMLDGQFYYAEAPGLMSEPTLFVTHNGKLVTKRTDEENIYFKSVEEAQQAVVLWEIAREWTV